MGKSLVLYKLNEQCVVMVPFRSILMARVQQDTITISIKHRADFTFSNTDIINFTEAKKSLIDYFQDGILINKGETLGN